MSRPPRWALGLLVVLAGCATVPQPGPSQVARDYAAAVADGRWDDAHALLAREQGRLEPGQLAERYPDQPTRAARAEQIRAGLGRLTVGEQALVLVQEGGQWRVVEPAAEADARAALEAFLAAAEAGDFAEAWRWLAEPLRARYTPSRLEQDFLAEPLSKERLERARAALASPPSIEAQHTVFPIGEGKAVRLVREPGGFRVVSLE
jgi:hypothetical protein